MLREGNSTEDIRRQRLFTWEVTSPHIRGGQPPSLRLVVVAGKAKASSNRWRLPRWLANPLVDVAAYCRQLVQEALVGWDCQEILLIIDGTNPKGPCVVCRLTVCYRGLTFPLTWLVLTTLSHSVPFRTYVPLLDRTRAWLPASCTATLLGDRGLAYRKLMNWCQQPGLQFHLGSWSDRIVFFSDGSRPGGLLATYASCHVAHPPITSARRRCREGWLLEHPLGPSPVSGEVGLVHRLRRRRACSSLSSYGYRMWIGQSIGDDKSAGWNWEDSPVTSPVQSDRLGLVMAKAILIALTEGTCLIDKDHREERDPHGRRRLSYFRRPAEHPAQSSATSSKAVRFPPLPGNRSTTRSSVRYPLALLRSIPVDPRIDPRKRRITCSDMPQV